MKVKLFLTPLPFETAEISHNTVAVIDVLRASTSICAALRSGARGVIPTAEPGEAAEMRSKIGPDISVLAGERNGVKIDNFQFGNSPTEFTEETVGGKNVIMTTTNGTLVFTKASRGRLVLNCSLVNISEVARRVAAEDRDLVIACAGEEGGFSIEDTLCGGMLINLLKTVHKKDVELSDAGSLALLLFRANETTIRQSVEQGEHGRYLASIGFAQDVVLATEVDSMAVLPFLKDGRLIIES